MKLTIQELSEEWDKADMEGRKLKKVITQEKNYDLNAVATIKMNAYTRIKLYCEEQAGRLALNK